MTPARTARSAGSTAPRDAVAVDAPALRLVDHGARPRRRALTRAATVLASALAAVGLFGVVGLHVLLTQGQAELDQLHSRADTETSLHGRLKVEVAQLEAPARVVGEARQRLGMVPLAAIVYLPATDGSAPLPPVPAEPLPASAAAAATAAADSAPASPSTTATPNTATPSTATPSTATPSNSATTAVSRQVSATTPAAGRP